MKRIYLTMIIASFAIMALTSCNADPKKTAMENAIKSVLNAPSTYKFIEFGQAGIVTLADEVEDRLEDFTSRLDRDKSEVERDSTNLAYWIREAGGRSMWKSTIDSYQKELNEAKARYSKTLGIVNYLKAVGTDYADIYNEPSYTNYHLVYEASNEFGVPIREVATGRFDMNGNLVAITLNATSSWHLFGDFFSIPGYYEKIR